MTSSLRPAFYIKALTKNKWPSQAKCSVAQACDCSSSGGWPSSRERKNRRNWDTAHWSGLPTMNEAQRSNPRSRKPKKIQQTNMELHWDDSLLPLADLQRPLQAELGGEAAASPEESISCFPVAQIWVHQEQLSHGRPMGVEQRR